MLVYSSLYNYLEGYCEEYLGTEEELNDALDYLSNSANENDREYKLLKAALARKALKWIQEINEFCDVFNKKDSEYADNNHRLIMLLMKLPFRNKNINVDKTLIKYYLQLEDDVYIDVVTYFIEHLAMCSTEEKQNIIKFIRDNKYLNKLDYIELFKGILGHFEDRVFPTSWNDLERIKSDRTYTDKVIKGYYGEYYAMKYLEESLDPNDIILWISKDLGDGGWHFDIIVYNVEQKNYKAYEIKAVTEEDKYDENVFINNDRFKYSSNDPIMRGKLSYDENKRKDEIVESGHQYIMIKFLIDNNDYSIKKAKEVSFDVGEQIKSETPIDIDSISFLKEHKSRNK